MSVPGVRWIDIPFSKDSRGELSVVEESAVSFPITRIFYMHRVPAGAERGGHAHSYTDQVIIPVAGRLRATVSAGTRREVFVVDDPNRGLYVPRMIWMELAGFSADSVTLVICNTVYVPGDVIRSYETFLARVGEAAR